ncbi:hypothetical protein O3M35_004868 [Rhynocoris fuscipes]|uniref:Uncharacterized protein n=1 Tax=Rhynocoris fuscipes TaxID=488301 RepID=A0AAW1DG61_9HEMI
MMLNDLVLQVSGTIIIFDMGGLSLMDQARLITPTVAWHLTMVVQVRTSTNLLVNNCFIKLSFVIIDFI